MKASLLVLLLVACSNSDSAAPPDTGQGGPIDTGGVIDTQPTGPIDVQLDTYNVGLAAAGVPFATERRPVLAAELAKVTGDVMCLQEVWRESDKTAIAAAMKGNYPHAAFAKTNHDTKIDDATDQTGKTPPPPAAPCAGKEADLDAGAACVLEKCSKPDGFLTSTDCAKENCIAASAALLGADDKTCYACFASNLATEKLSLIASVCKKPGYGLGLGGEASPMIVSKHPLSDVEHRVIPGCWQQRVITRATATLPNGAKLDLYCNHLTPVIDDAFIPYTCPWGGGAMTEKAEWESEQHLQAQKLVAWAATRPGRAVIIGDLNASPMAAGLMNYGQKTLDELNKSFVAALAPSFMPQCTFCKANTLTGGLEDTWLDHIFIRGIDRSAVKSTAVTFNQAIVTAGAGKVPMSDHYGLRVVMTVAP